VRRRIYGAHIRLSRLRSCWNEQCLASIPLAVFVSNSIPHSRSICRVNPRRYRNSGADGDGSAGRVHPTDRLFRLPGRLAGIRYVRKQSLPVVRRGFDHNADLCWRSCSSGRVQHARIPGASCSSRAHGRTFGSRSRNFPPGLDRRSSLDTCDDRLSRRHFGAYPSFPNYRASSGCPLRLARCSSV